MHPRIEQYLMGSRFAGVEVEMRSEKVRYHVVIIQKIGQKIKVLHSYPNLAALEDLPPDTLKGIPVAVTFTGKGVLYRTIEADADAKREVLLRKMLPNVSINDFYVNSDCIESQHHLVAVVRKSVIDPLLVELRLQFSVINVQVGALCVNNIVRLLEHRNENDFGSHTVHFNDASATSVSYNESENRNEQINVGGENISSNVVIAFSAAFGLLLNQQSDEAVDERKEFLQLRLFKLTARAALVLFFLIVAANYFAFSHYRDRGEELRSLPETNGSTLAQLQQLRADVEAQRSFLENTGLLNNSSIAWYADQLAHGMPSGIQLTQMNFAPRLKLTEEDTIGFDAGKLQIAGTCTESVILNRWLQSLNEEAWVSHASILSYVQDKSRQKADFVLDLQLW
jgi:Tfp pilus assembly protein PilN